MGDPMILLNRLQKRMAQWLLRPLNQYFKVAGATHKSPGIQGTFNNATKREYFPIQLRLLPGREAV
jgi:hypothetical protein